jgi:uncharacterized protein YndB with AHSA1/START domain
MDDRERGYTITRTFDVPRELVWDAWTVPEQFARWWGGGATQVEDVELNVEPGGTWKATMVFPNRKIFWTGRYYEVVPPERLVLDVDDGSREEGDDVAELFTVTLAERDGATELTLRQSGGHLTDEQYVQTREGTNSFLDTMEELVGEQLKMRHES